MSLITRICPDCHALVSRDPVCACGTALPHGCRTGLPAACLAWLSLLDQRRQAWPMLGRRCEGPRLYPRDLAQARSTACLRQRGRTLWAWLETPEALPPAGHANPSQTHLSMLRAIALSRLVLLEAPQPTPLFRAHYARLPHRPSQPPALAHVLDRLEAAWSLTRTYPHAVALVDRRGSTPEDRERLQHACDEFEAFGESEPALVWLLDRVPGAIVEPPESDADATARPAGSPPAAHEGTRHAGAVAGHGVVRIADVGGSCGRHLLARLHEETSRLYDQRPEARRRASSVGPVRLGPLIRAWPLATGEGLRWGRVQRMRNGEPPPGEDLPGWSGSVSAWRGHRPFVVELDDGPLTRAPAALIVGVGPSRLCGEGALVDVLETVWSATRVPAAVIRHRRADKALIQWVTHEMPHVPQFPDTWEGNLQALSTAFRLARKLERA